MLQTLSQVVENRDDILVRLMKTATLQENHPLFERAVMDGVMVFDDLIAKQYLEYNYLFDTHFAPNRLPGVGLSIGDVIKHDGKTYLTIHIGVMMGNVAALHLVREYEPLYVEWHERGEEMDGRVKALIDEVRRLNPDCFGIEHLRDYQGFSSYVGWSDVGTPSPAFVSALDKLATKLLGRKKKGTKTLALIASDIAEDIRPYTVFQKYMSDVRKKVGHKGFPIYRDGLLTFRTPTASGGASMHTYRPSDNLMDSMPSHNDLWMIAAQAGNLGPHVTHMGGGSLQGQHYFMLVPKTPVLPMIAERINADAALNELWLDAANFEGVDEVLYERLGKWGEQTLEVKRGVVREVVPQLVADRILGLYIDMTVERGAAMVRPVVAKSHFETHHTAAVGLSVTNPNFTALFGQVPEGIGPMPSVFAEAARA